MNSKLRSRIAIPAAVILMAMGLVAAVGQEITWYTIDGGGETFSAGGGFELGGTIGQPDAGVLTGGSFALVGGFWAVSPCGCPADINNDGLRNGMDVRGFVDCLVGIGDRCACADLDGTAGLSLGDVGPFVDDLLAGENCL